MITIIFLIIWAAVGGWLMDALNDRIDFSFDKVPTNKAFLIGFLLGPAAWCAGVYMLIQSGIDKLAEWLENEK